MAPTTDAAVSGAPEHASETVVQPPATQTRPAVEEGAADTRATETRPTITAMPPGSQDRHLPRKKPRLSAVSSRT
jgi:hypothetical protein